MGEESDPTSHPPNSRVLLLRHSKINPEIDACFDRSWDRIVAAGQSETNKLPRCCCGQWVQPMCPRCWVTLWSLHHGSPLGNTGHWRLCLDLASQIDNISDIYQTGNFNENKREPSATETEVNETSLFLFNGGESYNDSNQNAR